ncbi:alpha/beta fold hydrolase [Amycolatopsis rhizosphaerae]|uniref:Alpha/beta fold hydrolase n=1 Tax=Amycolatopsis rhizosphaerae TaxID=2053003 RepID=A0A558CXU6_9PSEU|nr:alpha/beta hydrolase [Amycolatopsis rhizosphaerae]TVT53540.1 alpha/beta fold hydrolase [Amycolatopsis rhizosphaerae]
MFHQDLYYEDQGSGPVLLFLHGWGTSSRVWNAQLPEFVRDHRVLTVDWRGCGRSGHPAGGNDTATVVADTLGLLDALEIGQAVLIGSSIGATFATELALDHPDRVTRVVAVDGPSYWPSTGMPLEKLASGLRDDRAATLDGWVPNWYAPGTSPALIDWTVRQILDAGPYIDAHILEAGTYDPRPSLPSLKVPVSYVHGELDAEIPLEVPETCASLVPDATLTVVRGSGHMPQQERPAEFNAALRAVL